MLCRSPASATAGATVLKRLEQGEQHPMLCGDCSQASRSNAAVSFVVNSVVFRCSESLASWNSSNTNSICLSTKLCCLAIV